MSEGKEPKVLLFLCQGIEAYEASVFVDVIGWTRTYGIHPIGLTTVGLHPKIKCAWNFTIEPELHVEQIDINEFDALVIPGGMARSGFDDDAYDERLLSLIRHFNTQNKIIASASVGSLSIAKSGILNGRYSTTYHLDHKRLFQMQEMGVNIIHTPVVVDNNVITSTSPSAGLDVAFMLVEKLTSLANLKQVKKGMGFPDKHI